MEKKNKSGLLKKSQHMRTWVYVVALLVNVGIFVCMGGVYVSSSRNYREKLFNENINTVRSLNMASASAANVYIKEMFSSISDIVYYINLHSFDEERVIQYLADTSFNLDRQFQIILSGSYGSTGVLSFGDYSGFSIRSIQDDDGSVKNCITPVSYGKGYYDILKFFTDIHDKRANGLSFAPEFTDPDTKLKCFAAYRHIVLTDSKKNKKLYTILSTVTSTTALNSFNMQRVYDGQSTVLVNSKGDYIIKSSNYRNKNFYDYIVNYNGLTLDKRDKIQQAVVESTKTRNSTTNLFYKNHKGEDCVFSVALIENGWYSITCVPISSFNLEDDSVNYSLIIMVMFIALFLIDGTIIYFVVNLMRHSIVIAEQATQSANNANQAKSLFLSTISHELRTPLNAIIGFASMSASNIQNPLLLRDYLHKIDISSKLLLQLISDILDMSAIESNKMKLNLNEFDVSKLITSLSAIFSDQCAAKGIEFGVVLKNMHSEILLGDSVRINQILLNFLSNAVKFTPSGGEIVLCAEQIEHDEKNVVIRFDICDTGCGISDELKARLFNPFERASGSTARRYSGTGLGLSIAKKLSELMNGSVGVESQEGTGSRFWVELPFVLPSAIKRQTFTPITGLRVLAAINNVDERKYIGQILSNFGISYTLSHNTGETLSLLQESQGDSRPFNLCILDWKMSDLDAIDTAKKVREICKDPSLRIMVLAYDPVESLERCRDVGVDLVFSKPVFPSALYNKLEELASGEIKDISLPSKSYNLDGKRILLVEDNEMNTEVAILLLENIGLNVVTAENGLVGFNLFAASENNYFDAILMDIQMPVMNGYEATAAIRRCHHPQARTIPILAMTADAFIDDVEKAHISGMNEHIPKPIEIDTLYATLKRYLG